MSFGEIIVVVIVAIFVMKPEDIPIIIDKFRHARQYFTNFKSEIFNYFSNELQTAKGSNINEELEEINFYLQKIVNLEGSYKGDYSLKDIKEQYQNLVKQHIDKDLS